MSKRTQESWSPPWIPTIVSSCSWDRISGGSEGGAHWEGGDSVPALAYPGASCFAQRSLLSTPSTPRLVPREGWRPGYGPLWRGV